MCKYMNVISDLLLHQLPGAVPAGVADVDPDPGAGPGELQGGAWPDQALGARGLEAQEQRGVGPGELPATAEVKHSDEVGTRQGA